MVADTADIHWTGSLAKATVRAAACIYCHAQKTYARKQSIDSTQRAKKTAENTVNEYGQGCKSDHDHKLAREEPIQQG